MTLEIAGGRLLTPDGPVEGGWLRCDAAAITALGGPDDPPPAEPAGTRLDAAGGTVLPGFVDVHVHGSGGGEAGDGDAEGLRTMAAFLATRGVTTFLPTIATASHEATLAALGAIGEAMARPGPGARIAGANLEGPYLSPARCGAQDPDHLRPADPGEVAELLATGLVRIITIAPEVEGNLPALARLAEAGVGVALGHADATYEQAMAGFDAGARHVTHLFNAMPPLHHRAPGLPAAALARREATVELITDGIHLHPGAIAAAWAALGPERTCVVTDALRATGLPEGRYPFGERVVTHRDGAMWRDDGGLAGSALTMDRALAVLLSATGAPLASAWPAPSAPPARAAGLAQPAALEPGGLPDLVVLEADLTVRATVVAGEVVHDAGGASA
ncbi:MAG: N-acetylglucosamine-6-phosphate deacetylase [Actinomycetota bacterium]